jgi:hypothetical protein
MTGNSWARHYQSVWQERAGKEHLPDWLRVAAVAYGSHRANGHALFGRGELAVVLSHVNHTTGEVLPMDRSNLRRAIQAAVDNGWLGAASTTRCLVVPAHAVTGGMGNPREECPQHRRARATERGAA